jgi:hypothetical protein
MQIKSAIQALAKAGHGTAFVYLGYQEDWDHGHLLISTLDNKAMAIIFHTQERTVPYRLFFKNLTHAEDLTNKMYESLLSGVDPTQRSWIYFLNDNRLELARAYGWDKRPDFIDESQWQGFLRQNTFTTKNLDPEKLGFPFREFAQIIFHRIDCQYVSTSEVTELNVLRISLADNSDICLHVSTSNKADPQ